MSAKRKSSITKQEPILVQVCKAIGATKSGPKGASRASIANYLINNNGRTSGAAFNAHLRKSIAKGIETGVLRQGDTAQRFKLGENAKALTNPKKPKKKKAPKKKPAKKSAKKKKTTKKKAASKKKKPAKKTTKKRKSTASKKKKPAKKVTKKKAPKKKPAKKSAKRKSSKK